MAVRSRSGPHVTPELFGVSGGRIICLTAASTLKVGRARRDRFAGIAARSAVGSFTAVAHVDVLDPIDLMGSLRAPRSALSSPVDVTRFVRDNVAELTGAAVDALWGRLGVPPARRVVLALQVVAAARLGADGVVGADGWGSLGAAPMDDITPRMVDAGNHRSPCLDVLPDRLRGIVVPGDVVLGWSRRDGAPLALPGRWDGDSVIVPRRVFEASGARPTSPAGVTFDAWSGLGPSGKQGVMLRGSGRARARSGTVRVRLAIDRATHWDGIETGTIQLDAR